MTAAEEEAAGEAAADATEDAADAAEEATGADAAPRSRDAGDPVGALTDGDPPTLRRTLPVFDETDRHLVQQFLNRTVAEMAYDHPDRKEARDIYHAVREGDAVRLWIGGDLHGPELVVVYDNETMAPTTVVEEFLALATEAGPEWRAVGREIEAYRERVDLDAAGVEVGFEYLY